MPNPDCILLKPRTDSAWLDEVSAALEAAERTGPGNDEPEGVRNIMLSDTLAKQMAARMRKISARLKAEDGASDAE